jgi:hypothetical protein
MQDGPFLSVHLYTAISYQVVTYSLVFFTAKNILVILLLRYKIFLYMSKLHCPKIKSHHHDDDYEVEQGEGGKGDDYSGGYGMGGEKGNGLQDNAHLSRQASSLKPRPSHHAVKHVQPNRNENIENEIKSSMNKNKKNKEEDKNTDDPPGPL